MVYTIRYDLQGHPDKLQDIKVPDEYDAQINSEYVMKLPWDDDVNNNYLPKGFLKFLKDKKIPWENY